MAPILVVHHVGELLMTLATILFSLAAILFSLPTILFSLPTILMELTMSEAAHGSSCRKLLMVHHVGSCSWFIMSGT
jgi:hypothetical protein